MTAALPLVGSAPVDPLDVEKARQRLAAGGGGYEIIHESPGLEVGVYVLVAPEPDHQNAHADDELYLVLEGRGRLTIGGEPVSLTEGQAAFVPAGAEHQFTGYEGLSVLVIFSRQKEQAPLEERRAKPHPV
jgi:mannose-6-phosphate isomerase-like protein (cupin superfamily)